MKGNDPMNPDELFVPIPPGKPVEISVPHFEKCGDMDPLAVGDQGWIPLVTFKDCLAGNDAIALGAGPSAVQFASLDYGGRSLRSRWTIGVNRLLAVFRPDFYLCAEDPKDVVLWDLIREADPAFIFTTSAGYHRRAIRFHGNARSWLTRDEGPWLGGAMSTWYAAALLAYMGCKTIGILGVDLYGHPRFGRPDVVEEQDRQWKILLDVLHSRGQELVNLSKDSLLTTIPKTNLLRIQHRGSTLAR